MSSAYLLRDIQVQAGQQRLLNIKSLELAQAQTTALLGDNGAGKTTLLQVLAFVLQPSQGQIRLFGQAISGALAPAQRRRIGLVSQQPFLLPGSVRHNIQLALRLQGVSTIQQPARIDATLAQLNLQHLAESAAASLSGGEQKRVALARALAYQPDILLLDEPFSHLDQRHLRQLEHLIQDFASQPGKTVIFSTHDRLQAQALSQRTISLLNGSLVDTPLLNVFHGQYRAPLFDTGKLQIHTSGEQQDVEVVAIDPREIIVSRSALDNSSVRNSFAGTLRQISSEASGVRLSIDCGERFEAIITEQSMRQLALQLGDPLFVSFKASAVNLL